MSGSGLEVKLIEVRDHATYCPVMAVRIFLSELDENDRYMMGTEGWGPDTEAELTQPVYMCVFARERFEWDPMKWGDRTFRVAHHVLRRDWHKYASGDVLDVRVELGEATEPVQPDRLWTQAREVSA